MKYSRINEIVHDLNSWSHSTGLSIQVAFKMPIMSRSIGSHIAVVVSKATNLLDKKAWNDITNSFSFSIACKQIFERLLEA